MLRSVGLVISVALPMKPFPVIALLCAVASLARAEVRVFVQASNGLARIQYECTAGEVVRSFALDVTVNHGQIVGVSGYKRGPSTAGARGYGIFPGSFRENLTVTGGTNVNWDVPAYSPLAVVTDAPSATLPGLNSTGVTLECGGLWDPGQPAAFPDAAGLLCQLQISTAAQVTVAANAMRGGVVPASLDATVTPAFSSAWVDPTVAVSGIVPTGGLPRISFQGGELETATYPDGPWIGTGDFSGSYLDATPSTPTEFYRVRRP